GGFRRAAQVAAQYGTETRGFQRLQIGAQLTRLLEPDIAQRDVQPALQATVGVPFGFAVANQPEVCLVHGPYSTAAGAPASRFSRLLRTLPRRHAHQMCLPGMAGAPYTSRRFIGPRTLPDHPPCPTNSFPVGVEQTQARRARSCSPTNVSLPHRISPWVRSTSWPCSAPRFSLRCSWGSTRTSPS